MNVLIVSLNFAPEIVGIGRYSTGMATWLARSGHRVTVLSAPPYYPQWQIQKPYRNGFATEQVQGLVIQRCPLFVPRTPSAVKRLLHLGTFALSVTMQLLRQLAQPRDHWPDRVIVVAPALFAAIPALLFRDLCRLRGHGLGAWLHIQDFELDAAFALGFLQVPQLKRIAAATESLLLRRFDGVSTLSPAMAHKLRQKQVSEGAIRLFPNWVHCADYASAPSPELHKACQAMRNELAIPAEAVIVLYAGSMGRKQGLELLAQAAIHCRDQPLIWWVFCGCGPAAEELQQACNGLAQQRFLPLQAEARYRLLMQAADLHVLPQQDGAADLVMPSKLLAMLASGRPVVATARPHTEVARVLQGDPPCGLVTPPGDARGLAEAVKQLVASPALRQRLGEAARDQARSRWDHAAVLTRFEQDLVSLHARPQLSLLSPPMVKGWFDQRRRASHAAVGAGDLRQL
ncbi:MAG: WcaI family glycosyltransferase [Cyanobacteriota bacterium]|nr:WcaI family glycosyltransferase [Cyanobacteriota bacterium]